MFDKTQSKYQYVWSARYIDAPVLRDKNTDTDGLCSQLGCSAGQAPSNGDERFYYSRDANMNVTGLVATNGFYLERYHYDVYGVAEIKTLLQTLTNLSQIVPETEWRQLERLRK